MIYFQEFKNSKYILTRIYWNFKRYVLTTWIHLLEYICNSHNLIIGIANASILLISYRFFSFGSFPFFIVQRYLVIHMQSMLKSAHSSLRFLLPLSFLSRFLNVVMNRIAMGDSPYLLIWLMCNLLYKRIWIYIYIYI